MHLKYILVAVLLVTFGRIEAQKPKFNYTQSWKQVDTFDTKGLTKSALELLAKIRTAAKADKYPAQLVKTIIYQIRLTENMEEEATPKNITFVEEELRTASFPLSSMLHSILAGEYWKYYQRNMYGFGNRTQTVGFKNNDITTWSLQQIIEKTIWNYQRSLLEPEKLKKIPAATFGEVLTPGNKMGRAYRPTLYDFLAHETVDCFMNNQVDLTQPAYAFTLNSPDFYLEASKFAQLPVVTRDTLAYKYNALKILQDLIKFRSTIQFPMH